MNQLIDLPNIGPVLAEELKKVGIDTPEALREVGAEGAWLRIRLQTDSGACLHKLQALAGAEAGVRKSQLTPERKVELREFFNSMSKKQND